MIPKGESVVSDLTFLMEQGEKRGNLPKLELTLGLPVP